MEQELSGITALITGGSSGMGFEMAKALLKSGAAVAIAARPGDRLDRAYAALRELSPRAYAFGADVRDEGSVAELAERFKGTFSRLDLLVNNAGVGNNVTGDTSAIRFYELPLEAFRRVMDTNFMGYYLVSRAFVPLMAAQGHGKIVNVSTSDRTMTMKGMLPYGPSRAASDAMSRILAQELAPLGITVNILCPGGATDTGMATEEMRAAMGDRMLPPTVLNEAILYLASPRSDGVTGEKITGRDFRAWLASRAGSEGTDAGGAGETPGEGR